MTCAIRIAHTIGHGRQTMSLDSAGIYSDRADLASRLAAACPTWTFHTDGPPRDVSRLAIVDSGVERPTTGKSLVRIVLYDGVVSTERRPGELRVHRDEFLGAPCELLAFAADLAEAALHASRLEHESVYLRRIHELMTMVDAEAVSERITTTVLGLLELPYGTLFLHDPRLERYVVSFSNDPSYRETGEFLPGIPPDLLQHALASGHSFAVERDPKGVGMIVMPLQIEHDLIGVIKVPLAEGDIFEEESTAGVWRYLSAVAQVLVNIYPLTRSRDLALRDDLTKAF